MANPANPRPPHLPEPPTVRVTGRQVDPPDTDYQLSASVAVPGPAVRVPPPPTRLGPARAALDPEARAQFQSRLRLCCLVAAGPAAFFLVCSTTSFIEPFGRAAVGRVGVAMSAGTLAALLAAAGYLFAAPPLAEKYLRALEIAVFGLMAVCFAYLQYTVLTDDSVQALYAIVPDKERDKYGRAVDAYDRLAAKHGRLTVVAAALLAHFNWFALIVFHGVLVPNSLARGAGVAGGLVAVAVAIDTIAAATHPPTGRHAGAVFAVAATMLAAGAALSVFGVAKTEALREQVRTAREQVRELGQYRLRKKLGSGGMGEVYLAEHRQLKRPCALKRIHPRYLHSPEQVRRFKREVQATARLRHPNTVAIYDYGVADDGTFFYVMEYLPGISLEELVGRHGPLPADRVVHVLRQVCGALREAHRQGLVHRDIKPSNILILPGGSPHDQAKLVDFGLVHTLRADADDAEKITRDGLIVGTPEYMSPEQASGGILDGRSDLFSLGSVAYYLLTGKEAFNRGNPMKTLLAVVGDEPIPVAAVNPFVPADVAAVVRRCLAKPPDHRFRSAAELADALAGCDCRDGWTEDRAADWWARHPDAVPPVGTDLDAPSLAADSAR